MRRRHGRSVGCVLVAAIVLAACGSSGSELGVSDPATTGTTATTELMVSCGSTPFPASAFDGPVGAEHGADPSDQALAVWLASQTIMPEAPRTGWRRLSLDGDTAQYASERGRSEDSLWIGFERHGDAWKWSGSGGCGA